MAMAKLLEALVDRELLLSAQLEVTDGLIAINVSGGTKTLAVSMPHPDEDLTRFIVWVVRPPTSAEADVRQIKDRPSGRTLGYVFPITSLAPTSDFCPGRLDGKFEKIFGSVAVKALIYQGVGNSGVISRFGELSEGMALPDIFESDLAVVVFGCENLAKAGIGQDESRLLLREVGYFPRDLPDEYSWSRTRPGFSGGSCTLPRVSADLGGELALLSSLICLASQQTSAVASVLIYYQVIEIASDKLFSERLNRIIQTPRLGAWNVAKALKEAASEQSRVIAICAQAATGDEASWFQDMRDAGVAILNHCGKSASLDDDPGITLYTVRNVIVHNQGLLGEAAHRRLRDFVDALHRVVFATIRKFNASQAT
jgi:hypothetical protein